MATPPDFTTGAILTAAQMNAVGLWLVKSQTIGTGVASVTVTDAFSADYDNYRIVVSGGVSSVSAGALNLTLGAAATGYYRAGAFMSYSGGSITGFNNSNATSWNGIFEASTNIIDGVVDLINPFAAKNTVISSHTSAVRTDGYSLFQGGYLADTTSYTALTITASAGNITGGTIRVYGYRN
jgi:hypothetical protein